MFCKPLIVPCIEVISVTAIVCKVGKPLLADIDRFVFKELSIGTACFLNDRTFPFPSVPLSAVRVIPVFRCNMPSMEKPLILFRKNGRNPYLFIAFIRSVSDLIVNRIAAINLSSFSLLYHGRQNRSRYDTI